MYDLDFYTKHYAYYLGTDKLTEKVQKDIDKACAAMNDAIDEATQQVGAAALIVSRGMYVGFIFGTSKPDSMNGLKPYKGRDGHYEPDGTTNKGKALQATLDNLHGMKCRLAPTDTGRWLAERCGLGGTQTVGGRVLRPVVRFHVRGNTSRLVAYTPLPMGADKPKKAPVKGLVRVRCSEFVNYVYEGGRTPGHIPGP